MMKLGEDVDVSRCGRQGREVENSFMGRRKRGAIRNCDLEWFVGWDNVEHWKVAANIVSGAAGIGY